MSSEDLSAVLANLLFPKQDPSLAICQLPSSGPDILLLVLMIIWLGAPVGLAFALAARTDEVARSKNNESTSSSLNCFSCPLNMYLLQANESSDILGKAVVMVGVIFDSLSP